MAVSSALRLALLVTASNAWLGRGQHKYVAINDLPPFLQEAENLRDIVKNRQFLDEPVIDLTPDNFEQEVVNSNSSIVIGFTRITCKHSKRVRSGFELVAKMSEGRQRFGHVYHKAFGRRLGVKYLNSSVRMIPGFFAVFPTQHGLQTREYYGPRLAEDIQAWACLHTDADCSHMALSDRLKWTLVHSTIWGIANLLKLIDVEPTDYGSGESWTNSRGEVVEDHGSILFSRLLKLNPLRDGGTIGFAGLLIGVTVIALVVIILLLVCLCRCRRPRK